jgi:hypothetical protein
VRLNCRIRLPVPYRANSYQHFKRGAMMAVQISSTVVKDQPLPARLIPAPAVPQ